MVKMSGVRSRFRLTARSAETRQHADRSCEVGVSKRFRAASIVDGFELHQLAGERNHLGLLDALSRRLRGRARPNANARTAAGIRGRNGLKQFAGIVEHGI